MRQPRDPPPAGVVRWTSWRKLDVVTAIADGRLDRAVALKVYNLSEEELASWERLLGLGKGDAALRATRLQIYRALE